MSALPEGAQRLMTLVMRSAPSRRRPRVSDIYEDMMQPNDVERAACYASMEDLADRLDRLAHRLSEDNSAVPVFVEEEDSLVVRVEDGLGVVEK